MWKIDYDDLTYHFKDKYVSDKGFDNLEDPFKAKG